METRHGTRGESVTYVVQLSLGAAGFRAAVRHVSCEHSVEFNDAGALTRFLVAAARAPHLPGARSRESDS